MWMLKNTRNSSSSSSSNNIQDQCLIITDIYGVREKILTNNGSICWGRKEARGVPRSKSELRSFVMRSCVLLPHLDCTLSVTSSGRLIAKRSTWFRIGASFLKPFSRKLAQQRPSRAANKTFLSILIMTTRDWKTEPTLKHKEQKNFRPLFDNNASSCDVTENSHMTSKGK